MSDFSDVCLGLHGGESCTASIEKEWQAKMILWDTCFRRVFKQLGYLEGFEMQFGLSVLCQCFMTSMSVSAASDPSSIGEILTAGFPKVLPPPRSVRR